MKLLMLTNDWPPIEGGISTLCVETARALASRRHDVCVLAPRVGGTPHKSDDAGVRVVRWRGYGLGYLRFAPALFAALQPLREADVVLAMNPAYGGLLANLSRQLGGPHYLCWAYGYELLRRPALLPSPAVLYRRVFNQAARAIAISRFTHDVLVAIGVEPDRIAILHPGVSSPLEDPPSPDDLRRRYGVPAGPIILSVGRLIERKGHHTLLDAVARLRATHQAVQWVIVGRGPQETSLRTAIAARRLDGCVHLVGFVDQRELDGWYRSATLFALTPRATDDDAEGFGLVYLEAGARGLPVVAGRSGGVVDAVSDGQTGLLVDPTDEVAIAEALTTLLDQPDQARLLGENGRQRALQRTWTAMAMELERLIGSPR